MITQQQPASVRVSRPYSVQASIENAFGNLVTTVTNVVTVSFANNPTGATLGGAASVTSSQGVGNLSGLTINEVGSDYTLQISSSSVPASIAMRSPDQSVTPLMLDSPDLWNGLVREKIMRRG